MRPNETRLVPGGVEPLELIVDPVRQVEARRQRRDRILGPLWHDDVAKDETAAGREDLRYATEEVCLTGAVEVVDGECRDDEVEWAGREIILEPRDQKGVDPVGGKLVACSLQHLGAGVDARQSRRGVEFEHSPRGFARPGAEIEDTAHGDADRRAGQTFLQLVVAGDLGADAF